MIRVLTHKETGKIYTIYLENKVLTTQSGNRKTEKSFGSNLEAAREFEKKEWEKLKKDFVYTGLGAEQGEARFHQYIGRAYTGCLSMVDMDGKIGVYKHLNFDNDLLEVFDLQGNFLETLTLPKALPWELAYMKAHKSLIASIDHFIYSIDLSVGKTTQWTSGFSEPASFIAVGENSVFYGAAPNVFLKNVSNNSLYFTKEVIPENYGGHTPAFTGCMLEEARLLALSTKAGTIELLDWSGAVLKTITGNFKLVNKMVFLDHKTLLIKEDYGTWGLKLIDLESGAEISDRIYKSLNTAGKYVDSFDINSDQTLLIVTNRARAVVYALPEFTVVCSFAIEHCIKRAAAVFFGKETIGVRTDYGCFSLYGL